VLELVGGVPGGRHRARRRFIGGGRVPFSYILLLASALQAASPFSALIPRFYYDSSTPARFNPKLSTPESRLPRAQVEAAGADITVSSPGRAVVRVRDPRPLRPPARFQAKKFETQAEGGYEITFKCYGADVTVPSGEEAACGGPEPPTPMPAPGFGFTGP
jgi:hypothetical protein